MKLKTIALLPFVMISVAQAQEIVEVSSLQDLARLAAEDGKSIRLKPGTYKMADYLTEEVLAEIKKSTPTGAGRPPVPMMRFAGNHNKFDLRGVVLEIDTTLYPKLPKGYTRCVLITGTDNTFEGLTIRNTGPNQGSNGNILTVDGARNTLNSVTLYVHGSNPYGYGDLLGKGGPNLVGLGKQSGILTTGTDNTLKRCRVISRAFGHCFYIQGATNARLEDCYAEGIHRDTTDMLRDADGPAFKLGFKAVNANRDGRFMITPGYSKALTEDGFRTYGNSISATLINCTAINTRAGFEIAGAENADQKTVIQGGVALGCERGYLIGSNTVIRDSRGDASHGPLLYLRGGKNSDIELQLSGGSRTPYTVHALATLAGEGHVVKLIDRDPEEDTPSLPILMGYGMPRDAEMMSAPAEAAAKGIRLVSELARMPVIQGAMATDCVVETTGKVLTDEQSKKLK